MNLSFFKIKCLAVFSFLIIFLCFSTNSFAINKSKKVAGPGWHTSKKRTDWPEHLKAKRPSSKEIPKGLSKTKGPMVLKAKKFRFPTGNPRPLTPLAPPNAKVQTFKAFSGGIDNKAPVFLDQPRQNDK